MKLQTKTLGLLAIIGFSLFILIVTGFDILSGKDPLKTFASSYVLEPQGWIMNLAFYCFAARLASLSIALSRINLPARTYAGGILMTMSVIGVLGAGFFDGGPPGPGRTLENDLHDLFSFLIFLSVIAAMFVYVRRFRKAGLLEGKYRTLVAGPWAALILLLAMVFGFWFSVELPGLGQRLFLAAVFSWLILAAYGIFTGDLMPKSTAAANA